MNTIFKIIFLSGFCFFASCTEKNPKLIPKVELETDSKTEVAPVGKDTFQPKLDILFVIDDSGSMSEHQQNLANNISKFADAIVRTTYLDYHVGVVTSTTGGYYPTPKCCGKLVGAPLYVDRNTPNGINALARNMLVGTSGDYTEKFFDPIYLALSDPLLTGHNAGFYRPEANLALIFITDTEDQSIQQDAQSLYDFLLTIKGSAEKIYVAAAHIPESEIGVCSGETSELEDYDGLNDFFKLTNAKTFSLCDDFGENLAEAGESIAAKSQIMYLSKKPVPKTIKVTMDGVELPQDKLKGWAYHPEKIAIVFGPNIEWDLYPPNTFPQVDFEVAPVETPKKVK